MKINSKVLVMLIAICWLVGAVPVSVWAAEGRVFTAPNGDNYTPYNLQWEDGANGIISFETQQYGSYYKSEMVSLIFNVEVYRDGVKVGAPYIQATNTTGSRVIMDISEYMEEAGTYYFTVNMHYMMHSDSTKGQVARSSDYMKAGGGSNQVEAPMTSNSNGDGYTPFNLQWLSDGRISYEKQGGRMWYYRLELFRNGTRIDARTVGTQDTVEIVDLSEYMTETGDYYFTIFACQDPPSITIAGGEVAQSTTYRYGSVLQLVDDPAVNSTPASGSSGDPQDGFTQETIDAGPKFSRRGSGGYRIYRSTQQGEKGGSLTDHLITSDDFIDVNVDGNQTYYYTVESASGEIVEQITVTTPSAILGGNASDAEMSKQFILMNLDEPTMSINGISQEIDPGRGTVPMIVNSRTLVPIRAIIEGMGGGVAWADATGTITLDYDGTSVEMQLNNRQIQVNGVLAQIDVPPESINDRTMVPIRFAAENLGQEVEWLNSTRQIVIVFQ